jgi:hypothetical protein
MLDSFKSSIGAAVLRIGLSTIMLLYYIQHLTSYQLIWGPQGQLDYATYARHSSNIFALYRYSSSGLYAHAIFLVSIYAALAYAIGVFPRINGILFAITVAANVDRNPLAIDAGQIVVVLFSSLLCFADTRRLSLVRFFSRSQDNLNTTAFATFVHKVAMCLITWQAANIYLWAAFYKLGGDAWRNGTAMHFVLSIQRFEVYPALSAALASNAVIVAVLTYFTLFFQMAFPFLVWFSRSKPIMVALGVSLHLGIAIIMGLYSFSATMIVVELSLLPDSAFLNIAHWGARSRAALSSACRVGFRLSR